MKAAKIITQYRLDATSGNLVAQCHDDTRLVFQASAKQCVNVTSLSTQALPMLVLIGDYDAVFDQWVVPADALLSVMPLAAEQLTQIMTLGQADQLLAQALG